MVRCPKLQSFPACSNYKLWYFVENLLDSSTNNNNLVGLSSNGSTPMMCNSPSASSSGGGGAAGGGAPNAGPGHSSGNYGSAAASSYKIQRQQANVRERKRIQRSAPTGYTKWSFPFHTLLPLDSPPAGN